MHSAVLALLGPALLTAHLASAASASSFPFGETDGVPNIPDKANCGTSPNKQLNQTLNLGCWRPDAELIKTGMVSLLILPYSIVPRLTEDSSLQIL